MFYEAKISASNSSRYLYGLVSHFCNKNKSSIFPNNVPLKNLPNLFIEFFTSKITKIRTTFSQDSCQTFSDISFHGSKLTNFHTLTTNDVFKIIMSSPVKSCTLDPLPTSMLVQNIDFLIDCISEIVNESLLTGTMPDCLKHAIISPLLKKQNLDKNELKNYRPVSNL